MTPLRRSSPDAAPADVTVLLRAWRDGDPGAEQLLMAAVHDELHRQAERAMRRESPAHTLQPTALVNEAYLRLVGQQHVDWRNRAHFYGVAAQQMRRVLVDHARGRLAAKRGGDAQRLSVEDIELADPSCGAAQDLDILALHDALERLAALDPDQERLVEMRYFSGMTIDETAEELGISPATVKREWDIARAWLQRELGAA